MVYIYINDTLWPAEINGRVVDNDWDGRESKAITLETDYATAIKLFVDGAEWSIIEQAEVPTYATDEDGEIVLDEHGAPIQLGTEIHETEWDNGEFNLAGDLTDHRDGRITAKMGKLTALEEAYEIMLGGM